MEEHVRNVARELGQRGHDVVVWTVARDGRYGVRSVEGIEVRDLPAPLPARSPSALLRFAASAPSAAAAWLRAADDFRPELIHVHCYGPNGSYARFVSHRRRIPLVVTSHGETIADDGGVFGASRFARASLEGALRDASAVTGCSHVVVRDLEARFALAPGVGAVVPNGIDLTEPAGSLPDGLPRRYVAAVGRLVPVKGFDLLLRAFANAELPEDVGLVIGGDGWDSRWAALRAEAERLGIGERLVMPGQLDRPQVVALLRSAAAVAISSRFESFGITALEAWRAGTPLVAAARGGLPEFITDGVDGLLCDPEDSAAFGAALRRVVVDAQFGRSLAAAGSERVRDFTWQHVADGYELSYAAALGRPAGAVQAVQNA
ncbi:glycosyltransferase family 4 protein [Gryllotalpicola daejeonensis]|uniref:glycosyltransferase family 4 protein n=1 Tax=Gryllotalpicola daejeonensis TaxID=993087 RepID=UPI0031CE0919